MKHRKPIIAFYAVAALVCLFLRQFVGVNYDITSYLPDEAASTVALNTMGDEFEGDIPNCRVMVPNVSIAQALKYKDKIKKVDGVEEVLWLDDAADIDQPLATQDKDTVETYYKKNNALFTVTVNSEKEIEATDAIRDIVGDEGAITGSAMSNALATTSTEQQISIITVAVIAIIFVILVITTTSWAEPILVLLGLGVSVFINWGTNLIFGEISFVTNSAGSILQVAIALDFSVFCCTALTRSVAATAALPKTWCSRAACPRSPCFRAVARSASALSRLPPCSLRSAPTLVLPLQRVSPSAWYRSLPLFLRCSFSSMALCKNRSTGPLSRRWVSSPVWCSRSVSPLPS